jgi:hypothetical protein
MPSKKKPENNQSRIEQEDLWRLVDKSVKANVGEYEISEASAVDAVTIVTEYRKQDIENKRRAGRSSNYKEGIWLATVDLVKRDPKITAPKAWDEFSGSSWESDDMRWEIYRDGGKLVQKDHKTGKEDSIVYDTFRTEYVSKAKKLFKD